MGREDRLFLCHIAQQTGIVGRNSSRVYFNKRLVTTRLPAPNLVGLGGRNSAQKMFVRIKKHFGLIPELGEATRKCHVVEKCMVKVSKTSLIGCGEALNARRTLMSCHSPSDYLVSRMYGLTHIV
jgi:hypothetical protein